MSFHHLFRTESVEDNSEVPDAPTPCQSEAENPSETDAATAAAHPMNITAPAPCEATPLPMPRLGLPPNVEQLPPATSHIAYHPAAPPNISLNPMMPRLSMPIALPNKCQNKSWTVSPDKETYRTVLVNYHFQNCPSAACYSGQCSCPATACCTRRNRERQDFDAIMKNRPTSKTRRDPAPPPKPLENVRIEPYDQAQQAQIDAAPEKQTASSINLMEGESNCSSEKASSSALEGGAGGAAKTMPSSSRWTHQAAKNAAKTIEIPKERQTRKLTTIKRADLVKNQQSELHRYRVTVELKRLELLNLKIERERQEMDRAKILFDRQMQTKGNVLELIREDEI